MATTTRTRPAPLKTNGKADTNGKALVRPSTNGHGKNGTSRGVISGANVVLATEKFKVVGTRPVRHDGVDKVTGRAVYGSDVKLPGLLYGRVLRSPYAHAHVRGVNVKRAAALPGVKAVVTGAAISEGEDRIVDLGEGAGNVKWMRENVLADNKVLYKGHPVAA